MAGSATARRGSSYSVRCLSKELPVRTCSLAFLSLGVIALFVQPAAAQSSPRLFHTGRMTGTQESPRRATIAYGSAYFNINSAETQISYVVYVQRIRNVVGAHIHNGLPGVNGPIVFDFFSAAPGGGLRSGVLTTGTIVRGVTPLPATLGMALNNAERFDALIVLMRTGRAYVNVHTNDGVGVIDTGPGDFPNGEIRGQLRARP
jgi:hypothetical protein